MGAPPPRNSASLMTTVKTFQSVWTIWFTFLKLWFFCLSGYCCFVCVILIVLWCLFLFRSLFFGDYMVPDGPERIYDEVTDLAHLTQQMEGWVHGVMAAQQGLNSSSLIHVQQSLLDERTNQIYKGTAKESNIARFNQLVLNIIQQHLGMIYIVRWILWKTHRRALIWVFAMKKITWIS